MSFQGADVDGLDRTANRCMEGADFADTVARALEILVAALEAMSWTGFAAALAAYLKAVVIPWVKYIARCLRIFGGLLQLASSKQKDASEDAPPVSIPATAWNPPPAPVNPGVNPPVLASPEPAIQQTAPGTGAQTGGGTITTTTGITSDGELWTRTTVSGSVTPATLTAPATIAAAGSTGGLGAGPGGHGTPAPVTSGADLGIGGGTTIGGSGPAGSGATGGPPTGAIGSGSSGNGGSSGAGDGTTGAPASDPPVQSSPLASRAVLGSTPAGATATGTGAGSLDVAAPVAGGGASAALAAAPLGLAGVGGAALAALRAKGLHDGDDDDGEDEAL